VAGPDAPLLVLRRPPLGHVLPTAHDMGREYRVLSALDGTDIPVPRPITLCTDPDVIGAPFYVMQHVPGEVLRTEEDGQRVSLDQARQLSEGFADMLAAIHGVDLAAVGLTGFGRPAGYLERQLARWQRQWDLSATREMPGYPELVQRLAAGLPGRSGDGTLVHGDYRLDNMLVTLGARPAIAAVLDWEMSTLGDPLADLGLLLVYWQPAPGTVVTPSVTSLPGFPPRSALVARYASRRDVDLAALPWYVALGCFKLAVVVAGIVARQRAGAMVDNTDDGLGARIGPLAEAGRSALAGGLDEPYGS
jgi:aminoglycoside phosphotransferase (APT) family kinase protein